MKYDVVIIGGGIVGLSTAWSIMQKNPGRSMAVLEKESQLGTHQTDRNSGVIHSGIYYKPGSAKAVNCVRGYGMLLEFCREHSIPFDICGKIIAATEEKEIPTLDSIYQRGLANGLTGIQRIGRNDILEKEPYCAAMEGIWVPQAGIIDFRDVALQLSSLIQQHGGVIMTGHEVRSIDHHPSHLTLKTDQGEVSCDFAIACAGLYSDRIARMAGLAPDLQIVPFRGEFYELVPSATKYVRGLIYPVPDVQFPFLGVHLTKRIKGGIEAGPNAVLAFRREGYGHWDIHGGELSEALRYPGLRKLMRRHWRKGMDEMQRSYSKPAFVKSIRRLVPAIQSGDVKRSRTGVRAQALDRHGNLVDDYVILRSERMLHVCNAPSPAATSCLSIGAFVAGEAMMK